MVSVTVPDAASISLCHGCSVSLSFSLSLPLTQMHTPLSLSLTLYTTHKHLLTPSHSFILYTDKHTNSPIHSLYRQTCKQTSWQTDRWVVRQVNRQTDWLTWVHRLRHRGVTALAQHCSRALSKWAAGGVWLLGDVWVCRKHCHRGS